MSHFKKKIYTSLDPQERVLLGPEGKRDELVGDCREAGDGESAADELLDDHAAPKSEARREGAEGTA